MSEQAMNIIIYVGVAAVLAFRGYQYYKLSKHPEQRKASLPVRLWKRFHGDV